MTVQTAHAGPCPPPGRRSVRLPDALASMAAIAIIALTWSETIVAHSGSSGGASAPAVGRPAAEIAARALGSETMIGVYGGAPHTYSSDVSIAAPDGNDFVVKDVDWDGKPFEDPPYYGVRIAHWLANSRIGGMLDYTHSKTIAQLDDEKAFEGLLRGAPAPAQDTLRNVFHKLEFSHGHNMLTLNGLLRVAQVTSWLSPYVGAGAGITLPHTEIHLAKEDERTYEYQVAGLVAQGLAGIEIRLPRLSLFIEYKFTFAPMDAPLSRRNSKRTLFEDLWLQGQSWWRGETPPGGSIRTQLTSHQIIGGLGVRLGPVR